MPYSDQDHERALNRLMSDMQKPDRIYREDKACRGAGIPICLTLLCFFLALFLLLATGCNTIAGAAADIEAAARGTQAYLADDPAVSE